MAAQEDGRPRPGLGLFIFAPPGFSYSLLFRPWSASGTTKHGSISTGRERRASLQSSAGSMSRPPQARQSLA